MRLARTATTNALDVALLASRGGTDLPDKSPVETDLRASGRDGVLWCGTDHGASESHRISGCNYESLYVMVSDASAACREPTPEARTADHATSMSHGAFLATIPGGTAHGQPLSHARFVQCDTYSCPGVSDGVQ